MSIAFDDLKLFYDFKTNPLVKTGFRKLKLNKYEKLFDYFN